MSALKIDRSFLIGAEPEDRDADAILRSTVALAHSLELPVVAEGIETPGQLRRMRALGCDFGQGFLFSRPADAERTRTLLARWPRAADPVKPE